MNGGRKSERQEEEVREDACAVIRKAKSYILIADDGKTTSLGGCVTSANAAINILRGMRRLERIILEKEKTEDEE